MGTHMGARLKAVQVKVEAQLRTQQPFNLKDLAREVDIPVDTAKAVSQYKVNRLRKIVYDVGARLGLHVFCDRHCNVIVASTLEAVRKAIATKMSQVTGRSEQMMFYMSLADEIRLSKQRTKPTPLSQLTLADFDDLTAPIWAVVQEGAALESAARKNAPLVSLRAKDSETTRRELLSVLVADPRHMDDFSLVAVEFYQQMYGLDLPAGLFSDGVVQPDELLRLWRQLVPGVRRLTGNPDLMRQAGAAPQPSTNGSLVHL